MTQDNSLNNLRSLYETILGEKRLIVVVSRNISPTSIEKSGIFSTFILTCLLFCYSSLTGAKSASIGEISVATAVAAAASSAAAASESILVTVTRSIC